MAVPAPDPAFLDFLHARLNDEVERASPDQRGVDLIHELLWAMEHGQPPDRMSLGLLTVAYAEHPDFRQEWNRWRR